MSRFRITFVLIVAVLFGTAGFAPAGAEGSRSAPLAPAPATAALSAPVEEPPVRIAAGFAVEPLADLVVAEEGAADAVEALIEHNRSGRLPVRVGIERVVPGAHDVRFSGALAGQPAGLFAGGVFAKASPGSTVWGASVRVANAWRLRLHLGDLDLPTGTRMWVYGDDGETVAFGPEMAFEGELWTPSVGGETIRLEVELPDSVLSQAGTDGVGFTVDRVGQLFELDATGAPTFTATPKSNHPGHCLVDLSCKAASTFPVGDQASKAVAQFTFPHRQFGFSACTGGLLNLAPEAPAGLRPPFLTANHCVQTPAEAAGVEAFWDFRTSSCGGSAPPLATLPRSNGSQILVTSAETDFTLLDLTLPDGRTLLGWNALVPVQPAGTELHRISHPVPLSDILPQQYTRYEVKTSNLKICGAVTDPVNDPAYFHHTVFLEGGTYGGSSGAPLMLENGQVVGQLLGACGPTAEFDGCDPENDELDGNFYQSFELAAPFLGSAVDPGDGWLTTPEVPGFEFQVHITPVGGPTVEGQAEANCIVETFCASGALAGRPEVFVKVIGPRPNGFLWVQISRFTPSEVEVMVRQTSTGVVQEYTLPAVGAMSDDVSGFQDRQAFVP